MILKNFRGSKKTFLILAALFLNLLIISPALAAAGDYTPLVKIPGINVNAGLLPYLNGVYIFLISIVGILAMAVLVYGGMRYITSVGNTASIEEAKDSINSALIGLVLALISWLIFNTINADILVLKPVGVGLPSGKYSDTAKANMCTAAPGSGTQASPCKCIDDPSVPVYKLNTGTTPSKIVSLAINPANPTASVGYTISGYLQDAANNAPIARKLLRINRIKSDLSSSDSSFSTTTDAAGRFGWFQTSRACISSERVEVVFDGDNTFASAEANLSYIITGPAGTPQCEVFPTAPGVSILSSSGNDCNSICSDKNLASDGKYHCMKADLRVGSSPYPTGKEVTISIAKKERVFMDARSYSYGGGYGGLNLEGDPYNPTIFDNGIDRYEINYSTSLFGLYADYAVSEGSACSWLDGAIGGIAGWWGVAGIDDWQVDDPNRIPFLGYLGVGSFPYTSAIKYTATLRVQGKSGGAACDPGVKDTVIINVVP